MRGRHMKRADSLCTSTLEIAHDASASAVVTGDAPRCRLHDLRFPVAVHTTCDTAASAVVAGSPRAPAVFRGLSARLGLFVARSGAGDFAYLETASSDPQYGRGDHLLDAMREILPEAASIENSRPLRGALCADDFFKSRVYLSLMGADAQNVAEWHFDGFDQVILAAFVGDTADPVRSAESLKRFEIAPPTLDGAHAGGVSGWAAAPDARDVVHADLRGGDVLYLPAGWLHRVTTRGKTLTINWGFYAKRSENLPPPASVDQRRKRRRGEASLC